MKYIIICGIAILIIILWVIINDKNKKYIKNRHEELEKIKEEYYKTKK